MPEPLLSVLMCNFRGEATLDAAIRSVLGQRGVDLELIVSDDGSDDGSPGIVRAAMARDARVKLIESDRTGGPAAARNRALDRARGDWIAIVDSDDLIHPDRLRRMLDAATRAGAALVCDDMVPFADVPGVGGTTLFGSVMSHAPRLVNAADFVRSESGAGGLGYCKPLISRQALGAIRYDETLGIGEDFDFLLRLLLRGRPMLFWPEPLYLYRRHAASVSHRLGLADIERQIAALEGLTTDDAAVEAALSARSADLQRQAGFARLVAAMKGRRPLAAARELGRRPDLAGELLRSVRERRARRTAGQTPRDPIRVTLHTPGAPGGAGTSFPVPPWPADGSPAPDDSALAAGLAELHGNGPLEVTIVGVGALRALGYVPGASRVTLRLLPGELTPPDLPASIEVSTGSR